MSILYFIIFKLFGELLISGMFRIGRLVDLMQIDAVIVLLYLIFKYEKKRWQFLMKRENE